MRGADLVLAPAEDDDGAGIIGRVVRVGGEGWEGEEGGSQRAGGAVEVVG